MPAIPKVIGITVMPTSFYLPHWHTALFNALALSGQSRSFFFHAYLFHGPRGVGHAYLVEAFAALLLCEKNNLPEKNNLLPCGECFGCRGVKAHDHPDLIVIKVKSGENIRIESVRSLWDEIMLRPQCASRRVVVIDPLDAMNLYAANAFLKMLEEPPPDTHFLMSSYEMGAILPTLLSRSQKFLLATPSKLESHHVILNYIHQQQEGVTLRADEERELIDALYFASFRRPFWLQEQALNEWLLRKECLQAWIEQTENQSLSLFECVAIWLKLPKNIILLYIQTFLQDAIKHRSGLDSAYLDHPDLQQYTCTLAQSRSVESLLHFYERTLLLQSWIQKKFNINWQSYFFQFLIDWNDSTSHSSF